MTDDSRIRQCSQTAKKQRKHALELQSLEHNHQIFLHVWRFKHTYMQNEHLMKADL